MQEVMDAVAPLVTQLVNASFVTASVPDDFKLSHIVPHLKKNDLDPSVLKNYCPVAYLSFLSKTLERVVAAQITTYLSANGLDTILDRRDAALMVLLDLSAAFDTIDHQLLLHIDLSIKLE